MVKLNRLHILPALLILLFFVAFSTGNDSLYAQETEPEATEASEMMEQETEIDDESEMDQEEMEDSDRSEEEEYADEEYTEEESAQKPTVQGTVYIRQLFQKLNNQSRSNRDNKLLNLPSSKSSLEVNLQVSDFFDENEQWKWLIKSYSHRFYENDGQSSEKKDLETARFDEAYIDWAAGDSFFSIGKRRNSWGPALAFNPVNVVVPPRDPLSPDQQTEGHPMFFFNYAGEVVSVDLILTRDYDKDWHGEHNRWGARVALLIGDMDLGFYYFDGESSDTGEQYNRLTGFSFSSNFLENATLYIESAIFRDNNRNYYNEMGTVTSKEETVSKTAIGSSITLDGNSSFLIEFYHISAGYTTKEKKNYFNAVDSVLTTYPDPSKFAIFADNRFGEMNKNYLLLSYGKRELYEKFAFDLQGIIANDGSYIAELSGSYNLSDYYQGKALLKKNSGDNNSEFGNQESESQLELTLTAAF